MTEKVDLFLESLEMTMEIIPSYGVFHILYTLIGFSLCGITAWRLRYVSDRTAGKILFVIGLILVLSEIFKQFYYFFVIEDNSYHWNGFPFQLCSIPMYMCLISPWLKAGKLQRGIYSFMVLYNLLGGAISFAEPSGLFSSHTLITIHSLVWHMLLVFVGLFLCFSHRGGNQKSDYIHATVTFLGLSCIAFLMNCIVQFGLEKHMNMFFVGPGNSPLAVFSQFSQWFGWYINTPIYIFAVCLGAYIVFSLIYFCHTKHLPFLKHKN